MRRWLYFPPLLSFLLLAGAVFLYSREAAVHLPALLMGGVIASYLCLCAVSGYLISRGNERCLAAVNILAQGVLLTPMSLRVGSALFAWLGLMLLLVGLILAFFYATGGALGNEFSDTAVDAARQSAHESERTESLLGTLPLPMCITDSKGIVLGATPRFFDEMDMNRDDVEGAMIGDILPIDNSEITLESGTWWIEQAQEGARHFFSLLPTKNGRPQAAQMESPAVSVMSIYDHPTGLYTDEYRKTRGPEEVARAQRYRRWLSGLMLEMVFESPDVTGISEQQKEMLFNAFGQKVKDSLRSMDCGFLMPKRRMQILLPETPQAGAKTLMGRLVLVPQEAFDESIREAVHPKVKAGLYFFNGNPPMDYGMFSASLEDAFAKTNSSSDA